MEEEGYINIETLREINQASLRSFSTINDQNWLEEPIDKTIISLLEKKEQINIDKEEFIKSRNYYPKKVNPFENPFEAEDYDIGIEHEILEYNIKTHYKNEELFALVEMKIIYLFKSFEINLKKLLKQSFKIKSTRSFFRWESIVFFLKSENINIKDIDSYSEIVQLKDLNNSLKHTDSLEEKLILSIPEFSLEKNVFRMDEDLSIVQINYEELNNFYVRVREIPAIFLNDLASKIYDEFYVFDDAKLENIATDLGLRMDKENALKLVSKIKKIYEEDHN